MYPAVISCRSMRRLGSDRGRSAVHQCAAYRVTGILWRYELDGRVCMATRSSSCATELHPIQQIQQTSPCSNTLRWHCRL